MTVTVLGSVTVVGASLAGLATARGFGGLDDPGGVRTDAGCATAVPNVLAVGGCAASERRHTGGLVRLEHWTNALTQPATAVATLLDGHRPPAPDHEVPYFWSDQYDRRLPVRRSPRRRRPGRGGRRRRVPRLVAVYRRAGEPVGAFAMNQPKAFGRWRREVVRRAVAPV